MVGCGFQVLRCHIHASPSVKCLSFSHVTTRFLFKSVKQEHEPYTFLSKKAKPPQHDYQMTGLQMHTYVYMNVVLDCESSMRFFFMVSRRKKQRKKSFIILLKKKKDFICVYFVYWYFKFVFINLCHGPKLSF